jgi:hypothetical protein
MTPIISVRRPTTLPLIGETKLVFRHCRNKPSPGARYDDLAHKIMSRERNGGRTYKQGQRDIKNLRRAYRAYIRMSGGIRLFKNAP